MVLMVVQLILCCALFTAMVKFAVRGGAIDGLYFYPKAVQDRAVEIGLTDRPTMNWKRKRFMGLFYIVMLAALILSIALWNRVRGFTAAYFQALLLLEIMNIYDGIVIDKLWGGHNRLWFLPRCEDLPYVQTWAQVLKKKSFLALIWVAGAVIAAGIIALIGRM